MLTDISASSNVVYITFGGDASDKIGITQLTPVTYSFNPDGTILTLIVNNIEYQIDFSGLTIGGDAPADVAAAYTALSTVFPAAGGGGGSSLFPVTGTGTATGAVTGALAGNTLTISGGNVGIGATPTSNQLFLVGDGSHEFISVKNSNAATTISYSDEIGVSTIQATANGDDPEYSFYLSANDGSNGVELFGEAGSQTITLSCANGFILSDLAGGGVTGASIDNNGKIIRTP